MSNDQSATDPGGTDEQNWELRYKGLQRIVSEKDRELATLSTERETLRQQIASSEADKAEFEAYRAEKAAAEAEKAKREQYEAMKAEFEPEQAPPPPQNPNESNRAGWNDRYPLKAPEAPSAEGWPT